jgi:hypothetical protein
MDYDKLQWPCPECRQEDLSKIRWSDSQPNYARDEAGKVTRFAWSMRWDCDVCGESGRMTYAVH